MLIHTVERCSLSCRVFGQSIVPLHPDNVRNLTASVLMTCHELAGSRPIPELYLKLDHGSFLLHVFQFITQSTG
jgi:hypothetical protein